MVPDDAEDSEVHIFRKYRIQLTVCIHEVIDQQHVNDVIHVQKVKTAKFQNLLMFKSVNVL